MKIRVQSDHVTNLIHVAHCPHVSCFPVQSNHVQRHVITCFCHEIMDKLALSTYPTPAGPGRYLNLNCCYRLDKSHLMFYCLKILLYLFYGNPAHEILKDPLELI